MRRWRKRKASSPAKLERSGRISSRRTRASRWRVTSAPHGPLLASSATELRQNTWPTTDAHSSTARSSALEAVEASGEEGGDRRRDGHRGEVGGRDPRAVGAGQQAVVDQHGEHLLHEQRVALGRLGDAGRRPSPASWPGPGGWPAARWPRRSARGSSSTEVALGFLLPQAALSVEQLGAGGAEQQERGVPRPVGDVLDEVQQGGLRPLDVVEHHDQGTTPGQRLEEGPQRPRSSPRARQLPGPARSARPPGRRRPRRGPPRPWPSAAWPWPLRGSPRH